MESITKYLIDVELSRPMLRESCRKIDETRPNETDFALCFTRWEEAIAWSRERDFSHFLAVGGGSVIDTTKGSFSSASKRSRARANAIFRFFSCKPVRLLSTSSSH